MNRLSRYVLVIALAVAACAGEGATTTTEGEAGVTTTTAGAESTTTTAAPNDDDGQTVGLDDIPQECIDAFVIFLQAIEPIIEGIDFENMSIEELEAMGNEMDPAMADYEAEIAATGCDQYDVDVEADDDESFEFLISLAEDEAPGTVPYLEWIRDFALDGTGQEASGDCDTDLAAMDAIIAEGGTMQDLSMGEVTYVGSLMSSISLNCDADTSAAFFARNDVQAFLGNG